MKKVERTSEHVDEVSGVGERNQLQSDGVNKPMLKEIDGFEAVFTTPGNPSALALDFDGKDNRDKPLTCEGALLTAVLNSHVPKVVTVLGEGGVGKTCAIRAVGRHPKSLDRFSGGILYASMGKKNGEQKLRKLIAEMVKISGGRQVFTIVNKQVTLEGAVQVAKEWFGPHPCLFILDDLSESEEINLATISILLHIAQHPRSCIAFTTRNKSLQCGACVLFEPRGKALSQKILLKSSEFFSELSSNEAQNAFQQLADSCSGLPITLSIVGGSVRRLADSCCRTNPDTAWSMYELDRKEVRDRNVENAVIRLFEILDDDNPTKMHWKRFISLCILEKASDTITAQITSRLWNVSDEEAVLEVELLSKYRILQTVDMSAGNKPTARTLKIGLHDSLLDIARKGANKDGLDVKCAEQLIISYQLQCHSLIGNEIEPSDDSLATSRRQSPEVALEHTSDVFEHLLHEYEHLEGMNKVSRSTNFHRWWHVEDDGYICKNICWLLLMAKRTAEVLWLVSQPLWVIDRFVKDGVSEIESDLQLVLSSLQSLPERQLPKTSNLDEFFTLLQSAVLNSRRSVVASRWVGMAWFQLHGRLAHFVAVNSWVKEFVRALEHNAPKSWFRPGMGCLPAAGGPLQDTIKVSDDDLCFALIGKVLFTCLTDGDKSAVLEKYDVSSGLVIEREVIKWDDCGNISCITLCNKGSRIVTGFDDGTLSLWESPNGQWVSVVLGIHKSTIECVACNRNGTCIVFGAHDGTVGIWKDEEGEWMSTVLEVLDSVVERVAVNCSGTHIASVDENYKIRIWNIIDGSWSSSTLERLERFIESISWNECGSRLTITYDESVHLWEDTNGHWVKTVFSGEGDEVSCLACHDGYVVCGTSDGVIRFWEKINGCWECIIFEGHEGWIRNIAFNYDRALIISWGADETVRIWDPRKRHLISPVREGHDDIVLHLVMNQDGSRVVSASKDHTVRVWENQKGDWVYTVLEGHKDIVRRVALSNDGSYVASCSRDHTVRIWKSVNGEWTSSELEHNNPVEYVTFMTNGTRIVTETCLGIVQLWEKKNEKWKNTALDEVRIPGHCVAFRYNGAQVVTGSTDYTVRLWKSLVGKWVNTDLHGHKAEITCFGMNYKQTLIASGSKDKSVRLWENVNGSWRSTVLESHKHPVTLVALNHDGTRLVSIDFGQTIHIWEKNNEEWRCVKIDHSNQRTASVEFSSTSNLVLANLSDGFAMVWEKKDTSWQRCEADRISRISQFSSCFSRTPILAEDTIVEIFDAVGAERIVAVRDGYIMTTSRRPYLVWIARSIKSD